MGNAAAKAKKQTKAAAKTPSKPKAKSFAKTKRTPGQKPSYTFVSTRSVYVARDHLGNTKSFSVSKYQSSEKAEDAAKKWVKQISRELGFQ